MLFRFSDVYKSYSARVVLSGTSFQINPGEKVGLVGRNGAGKTTLFRLLEGVESPDSGEIVKVNGLRLGFLDQHVEFDEGTSVHEAALSAFEEIRSIESRMRDLESRMAVTPTDDLLEEYAHLQADFDRLDGFSYGAKAEAMLLGLGFGKESWKTVAATLSGGQKNRLGLVRLLLAKPDVLLLDEPTNHLDMAAVEWLENYLMTYDSAFLLISHDRYFLDRTCNRIIELERGGAVSYKGNYSKFLEEREIRREIQRREYENQQAFIAKNEEFIRRNIAGQKTKLAKSRRNMLERIERVDAVLADKSAGNFELKGVERAGDQVLAVEDLAIGYQSAKLSEHISFSVLRGECLGIIGSNGSGKTTFLRTIHGKLSALAGDFRWGSKVQIGYYSQQLEDLDARNDVLGELRRVAPSADNGELRSFLARFLFVGDEIFKSVGDLSGGEKGRLSLAKLIYSRVNVLLLDEPTNHLDIPSREALEAALESYPGTIITVSHDRYFLDRIATKILSLKRGGSPELFSGNYSEFHDWLDSKSTAEPAQPEASQTDRLAGTSEEAERSKSTLSKNQRQKLESRIGQIEEILPVLEEKLASLAIKMGQPEIASNHEDLERLTLEYQSVEAQIHDHYEEWDNLNSQLEN